MAFLLRALQNKKPRYSQDRYDSLSEISNSPIHPPPEELPRVNQEIVDIPLNLITKHTTDNSSQTIDRDRDKTDPERILPGDHFNDDNMFMNSLLPLFKKMDDDTRLLCRIEVLKIIRYALQGNKCFAAMKLEESAFFKNRMTAILAKEEAAAKESTLSMTTRSADGSRPIRKRPLRSPSPLPVPAKRRGPGRPRKIRPQPSDSDEEQPKKHKSFPKLKVSPIKVDHLPDEESVRDYATSLSQLSQPMFMRMYDLESTSAASKPDIPLPIKSEPLEPDPEHTSLNIINKF
ncbi:unnamed protein product [Leptidea sinapis]|uniref:BESS domain-containing protein n=3 Tax=Leptidea sinapis TaxID=189913 RepID=A0A5E4QBB7_9NEOP|nr:unnamed protein product [Leptidea sinapis]